MRILWTTVYSQPPYRKCISIYGKQNGKVSFCKPILFHMNSHLHMLIVKFYFGNSFSSLHNPILTLNLKWFIRADFFPLYFIPTQV